MLTPEQSRAARGLLDWSQQRLADAAQVGLSTVRDFEKGRRTPIPANLTAIRAAIEAAGVDLLPAGSYQGNGGPGARLRVDYVEESMSSAEGKMQFG
ncbi:helix-turn-helix domain-containing protein [Azospirillum argentinense]|uniref:Helix-turn-helix domain-containing protein n=1 Tax=Azospirillum argentinense TaxID=2970906 RepID=A0ABW8V8Y6_9PROT